MLDILRAYLIVLFCAASSMGATLVRGPYLQSGSSTGMVVRWRTDVASDSVLRFGTNVDFLDRGITNGVESVNHELPAAGLTADTQYFYSIGSTTVPLASGTNYSFRTAPTNARPLRIWVIGDSGTADEHAAAVRDSYSSFSRDVRTDLWLMLGDNAYGAGTDEEYQAAVFDMYPSMLSQVPLWPALGNHDTGDNDPPTERPAFPDIFTLPQRGECGGVASGSELYYSFDYANIHFICLDSQTGATRTGIMVDWLKSDLAATEKDWIVAFWHHPPYSWGTHDSDTEYQMIEMRERILPVLEDHGVDLVLCGHSHVYERSYFLDRHYGYSWELSGTNIIDTAGVYRKPSGGQGAHGGTVYAVCGNSGAGGSGEFPLHPAMAVNTGLYGSMVLDFNGLRMTGYFLRDYVETEDGFIIDKTAASTLRPLIQMVRHGESAMLSWPTSNPIYTLEKADALAPTNWQAAPFPIQVRGRSNMVETPMSAGSQFFRLRSAP